MAQSVQAFLDKRGNMHRDPESAVIADLSDALGRVGDQTGIAEGVARIILARREEIEQAFSDLDILMAPREINFSDSVRESEGVIPITDAKK